MVVILLSGWSGSGKDAAANLLIDEMNFIRLAFADMLKLAVSQRTDIPLHYFHDRDLKDVVAPGHHVTPRQLLLEHAIQARATDPDIYSRLIAEIIRSAPHDRYVVSDWRYQREYDFLADELDADPLRFRIKRPGVIPSDDHTEHDLDNDSFDVTIDNSGCVSDLRDAIKAAVRPFL